jgi:hypothetical protein
MKCITCGDDAVAICKLCGRAVCKQHIDKRMFMSGYSAKSGFWNMNQNALRVEDAVWCGICHPEYKATS